MAKAHLTSALELIAGLHDDEDKLVRKHKSHTASGPFLGHVAPSLDDRYPVHTSPKHTSKHLCCRVAMQLAEAIGKSPEARHRLWDGARLLTADEVHGGVNPS